ncbi:ABC transporter substrate-binding protein [Phyllobacterium leguminum]|uniref:Amino acid/amide ABC transporter substrate-binding protein (HAAT family) n=1 Tax=Phyllobacterium leguminum TaxID=314237 RepID=A0A318T8L2_9HYPH|nr:ABC transporter substrate-binding protein [Phyllobacterium leguminum]PYE89728.1 amino acid/amide ABC transporter substrate-binding protein (HAAT family) [Phyllobacterium leguminum]
MKHSLRPRTILLGVALSVPAAICDARADMRIGVATPLSGPFALLGQQLADGAHIAATSAAPTGQTVTPIIIDDKCTAEGGSAAARTFIEAKVQIVAGFLCTEALEAALPQLAEKNIPVVTPAIRERNLTERRAKSPFPIFRLALSSERQAASIGDILGRLWRDKPFAILDDGTIRGRELAHHVRLGLEAKGLKPVLVETFRPGLENQAALAALLKRAGASQAFIGGERDDAAAIAGATAAIGHPVTVIGDEALRAVPGTIDLVPGTLMIAMPEAETLPEAAGALAAFHAAGREAEGYAVPGYAALQIAMEALVAAAEPQEQPVAAMLRGRMFNTALGPIRFDASGYRGDNPYRLFRYDGTRFVPENLPN